MSATTITDQERLSRAVESLHLIYTKILASMEVRINFNLQQFRAAYENITRQVQAIDYHLGYSDKISAGKEREGAIRGINELKSMLIAASGPDGKYSCPEVSKDEILKELEATIAMFSSFTFDTSSQVVVITKDDIVLDIPDTKRSVNLGKFKLVLRCGEMSFNTLTPDLFKIYAVTPNPSQTDGRTYHPHVSHEGKLCSGEATVPISTALKAGRLSDAFELVLTTLKTYNPASPYQKIELWNGQPCHNCDGIIPRNQQQTCGTCGQHACQKCRINCEACGYYTCLACCLKDGDKNHCPRCYSKCKCCDKPKYTKGFIKCAGCAKNFCPECVSVGCKTCKTKYCKQCQEAGLVDAEHCKKCRDKVVCTYCGGACDKGTLIKCELCAQECCGRCTKACCICHAHIGGDCLVFDVESGRVYCKGCAGTKKCGGCDKEDRAYRMHMCEDCGDVACKDCWGTCSGCGDHVCKECLTKMGSSGHYKCKNCANLAACSHCNAAVQSEQRDGNSYCVACGNRVTVTPLREREEVTNGQGDNGGRPAAV